MNINLINSILLMAQPNQEGGGSGYQSLIFLVLIVVIFYFFFIRPQMKRSKEQKIYRESLKKGDKIITIGGIHGKIIEVQETTFTIDCGENVRLRLSKTAVAGDGGPLLGEQK